MKKTHKKLQLKTEAIKVLNRLEAARGGLDGTAGPACDVTNTSCPPQASCFDCGPYSGNVGCGTSNEATTCGSRHSCPC